MTIRAQVNARGDAVVQLRVRQSPGGDAITVSAIVDTGFTGTMTLPAASIASLGLSRQSSRTARLGDGTVRQLDLFAAEVEWGGVWRSVLVHQAGREVLIGTRLLTGFRSAIDWVPGGMVEFAPMVP